MSAARSDMDSKEPYNLKPSAYERSNIFARLFVSWINPVLATGNKRKLNDSDLFEVAKEHKSSYLCEKLEKNWNLELERAKRKNIKPSLVRTFFKTYLVKVVAISIFILLGEACRITGPILIGELTGYLNNFDTLPAWRGYAFASGLAGVVLITPFCFQSYFLIVQILGWNIRTAMVALMYKKTLRLNYAALLQTSTGHIVNLSATDVLRFDYTFAFVHYLWAAPLEAAVVVYILWLRLGPSPLAGVSVFFVLMILQSLSGRLFGALRFKAAHWTDERISLMSEIISGMRIIKMYSWEKSFFELAKYLRTREIRKILQASLLRSFNQSSAYAASQVLTFTTFMVYIALGGSLTTETLFVAIGLFSAIRFAVGFFFPTSVEKLAETITVLRRIEKFLLLPEKDFYPDQVTDINGKGEKFVELINFTGSWEEDNALAPAITDISMRANQGKLMIVIGPVGSGKTTLLSAILGELLTINGQANIRGKIGYCSQVAWLFSATIRENILFGEEFNEQRYQEVVEACALKRDFEILSNGDFTLVGERGITLSGGQKARINLARLAYRSNLDIVLLDDPLSAVDPSVADHLFNKCICGYLKDKIRILVTHQLQFLENADELLILKEGKVIEKGKYNELIRKGTSFASYVTLESDLKNVGDEKMIKKSRRPSALFLKPLIRRQSSVSSLNPAYTENELLSASSAFSFDFNFPGIFEADESEMPFSQQVANSNSNQNNKNVVTKDKSETEGKDKIKKVSLKIYYEYFVKGVNVFYFVIFLVICMGNHVLLIMSDWWITNWASTEEQFEKLVRDNITNVNMFTNSSLYANSSMATPTVMAKLVFFQNRQYYVIVYSILTPGFIITIFVRCAMHFYLCISANSKLHTGMLTSIFKAKIRFFDVNPVGSVLNRFSKDLGQVDELLPYTTLDFLFYAGSFLTIIIFVVSINYFVIIIVVPMLIYCIWIRTYFVRCSREIKRIEGAYRSPVFGHLSNTLQGLVTIRSFGMEERATEMYHHLQDLHGAAWFLFLSVTRWVGFRLDLVSSIFVIAVAFFAVVLVSVLPDTSPLNASNIGLTLAYSINLLSLFQWMIRQSAEAENLMTSVERIYEYHNLTPEVPENAEKKEPPSGWPQSGAITMKNVDYAHFQDGPCVLKSLNLEFNAKEKVGIVGRTGAGKSSLIAVLFRMSDQISGKVSIDGIDTSEIELDGLRASLAIIPQDPVLFGGTMRRNLDVFSTYTDDQLWNALEKVQLKSVVESLPLKLETELAESGSNFSVGQRQLVCLARAILRNNRILIIDEATANVDLRTDRFIQETIRKEFSECTVLTIAHRLNTIIDSDRILVLDAGEAIEFDKPHILLQDKNGLFNEMVGMTGTQEKELRTLAEKAYHACTVIKESNDEEEK
ncbi:ATP-binding cassette sub-family C member 4-like isoform X1 [Clavelina lepadiformis]|uniref:ATP-binding cassette sub-family C member 4-like isoform X1 n=1 Tax=Clavelina lepadiformis TaxID=159417 RepID=UPI004043552F